MARRARSPRSEPSCHPCSEPSCRPVVRPAMPTRAPSRHSDRWFPADILSRRAPAFRVCARSSTTLATKSFRGPLSRDVAKRDGDRDRSAEPMDSTDQPFQAAAIDQVAAQLRHSGLANAEFGGEQVLRLRAQGARELAGELAPERMNRVIGCARHSPNKGRRLPDCVTVPLRIASCRHDLLQSFGLVAEPVGMSRG